MPTAYNGLAGLDCLGATAGRDRTEKGVGVVKILAAPRLKKLVLHDDLPYRMRDNIYSILETVGKRKRYLEPLVDCLKVHISVLPRFSDADKLREKWGKFLVLTS